MEIVERIHPTNTAGRARVVLFDFDGTISHMRTGWVDVMVHFMVEVLLDLKTGESEEEIRKIVVEFVARLTGEQTIYQMIELAREVELRGGKALRPEQYKKIYQDELMRKIEYRRVELRQGKISPEKYLIPGARALLDSLKARGLKMYCASGTDHASTVEETELLGIRHYFDGGVYGAQEDYKSFSKEIRIQQMVSSMECRGDELLGFGDGLVEIKNVKDAGGVAVGVASSEPECRIVDEWKRQRLVGVGADFIVPNFLGLDELTCALFPKGQ
ncbi:MAG: HAD hydrolase-like protein [Acidobacteria bacterium]|nr:HAD hydrolase-like protein [Acidobacteriota bacterium]